jgi:hypothetical protein
MLRHIVSVGLAMTACASLIPTKANAATLTMEPVGTLQKNPGDAMEFLLELEPINGNEVELIDIFLTYVDEGELSYRGLLRPLLPNTRFTTKTTLGTLLFAVLQPVKDGRGDVQIAVDYRERPISNLPKVDVIGGAFYDVQPVPEPVTIFGTATALGCGVLFKRKSSKKTVS